jgi:hypothetical protein
MTAAEAAHAWLEREQSARASLCQLSPPVAFDELTRTREGAAVLAVVLDQQAYDQSLDEYLEAVLVKGDWERWGILKRCFSTSSS